MNNVVYYFDLSMFLNNFDLICLSIFFLSLWICTHGYFMMYKHYHPKYKCADLL